MALNQTLDRSASTVVVSGDTGARANGRDEVTITVTAKDTSAAVIPYAEVFIEEASGRHFISDAEMPQPPVSEGLLRGPDPIVTDANGVATVKVKSFYEGTLTFDVFVGAPQGGTGGAAGAGVFNGNNVDSGGVYTQKTLAADVGATGGYTTTYSSDQVIDAAWLAANNGSSTAIQDTRFQNCMVTVTTEVQFTNCLFEGGSNQYALLVNLPSVALSGDMPANYLLQDCTLTGGTEAALSGYRIHMIDCLVEECGKHGIQLTKRSGTGAEPVQVVRCVVRKVGSGGSTSAPQGYGVHVVDSGHVTFRGLSVECPYHTTGGAIAGYYPVGAVYVGADEEPITDFFFYTSWIDGGVLLDDAGLGIGPEGQMFSPNFFGRNYNPAVPLFDTADVQSLWTKGQMWMDTGALVSNEEAGGNIRTFTGKKYNNLWASGAALDTQATFTLDTAYALVTLDAFDQFGPFNQNLLDQPPLNTSFGDWTPATINSSPVPTVLAETPLPFPQTGTADRISFNNSAAFADGALVRSRQVDVDAGFTAPYEVEVAAANGDGFKTVLSLKDSPDDLVEQTTVAFSNVFAEDHIIGSPYETKTGWEAIASGQPSTFTDAPDPLGGNTAWTQNGARSQANCRLDLASIGVHPQGREATFDWWIYTPDLDGQVDVIFRTVGYADIVRFSMSSSGAVISFITTSYGPSYTQANALRITDEGGGWLRIRSRLADYSAAANQRFDYNIFHYSTKLTVWSPSFYLGDHVSSQQLLTVEDGVENLLLDAGYGEFSDLTLSAGASIATSSIAAPDGTLTAVDVTSASAITLSQDILDTDFGAAWNEAATWTASWYVYTPSLSTSSDFVVALLNGATVQESATVTIDSDGDITSFTGVTQGAPSLSAERTIYAQSIGNTGWIKYEITLHDNGASSDRVRFIPISASSASNTYTLWSPELRYGDWVARGKNRVTSGDDLLQADWTVSNATVTRSDEVTPAGTSSSVLVVPDSGTGVINARGILQGWETLGTAVGRITLSAYYKDAGMGYAAMGVHNYGGYHATATFDLATGSATVGTHPSPATDLASSFEDVGGGWKFCSFTFTMPIGTSVMSNVGFSGSTAPGYGTYNRTLTGDGINGVHIWGARVHLGNPADARGYFVSGPQNLLGDGSDYSSWTAGTN